MSETLPLTGVSLFSSAGIADLAVREAGFDVGVASELLPDRADLYKVNHPRSDVVAGDIRLTKGSVIDKARHALSGRTLDLLIATPPCQGMSKNGRGKLLSAVRAGARPAFDPRNQLVIDAVDVALALRPQVLVFENVSEMESTLIQDRSGKPVSVLDFLHGALGHEYVGHARVVEFADYGVPQRRQRLLTIFSRHPAVKQAIKDGTVFPQPTHSKTASLLARPWVSVQEAIGHLPPLDASNEAVSRHKTLALHRVPLLDEDKYFWVSSTPPGRGAFDNQCVNPRCGFAKNQTHGSRHDDSGINRSNQDTPIRCEKCLSLLPRPWVEENGKYRLMTGFTSAYKRMRGDLPASALTRNLSYACSDQKLHPTQNRVLSLLEACVLHTITDYEYRWEKSTGKPVSDKTIREVIGESVPPTGLLPFLQRISFLLQAEVNKAAA